jgi:hypothetical protein
VAAASARMNRAGMKTRWCTAMARAALSLFTKVCCVQYIYGHTATFVVTYHSFPNYSHIFSFDTWLELVDVQIETDVKFSNFSFSSHLFAPIIT